MISRRQGLALSTIGLVQAWLSHPVRADSRKFTIYMLLWRGETAVEEGFRTFLAEQEIDAELVIRNLDRDLSRLPAILDEIRDTKPHLIYTWGTGITLATVGRWDEPRNSSFIKDIPVVFAMVSAPVETGIIPPSGQPPRRNVTGAVHVPPLPVQIAAMQAYLPLKRIGVVFNPAEANSVANVAALKRAAEAAGVALLEAPVPAGSDGQPDAAAIPDLVAGLAGRAAQLLYIGPDNFIGGHRDALTDAGLAHGLPAFTATELEIRDGDAMFGLVSRYDMVGRLAGLKAKEILVDGQQPDAVPVETLERFSFVIRLPIALKLGLYPPLPILDYAEVIR